MMPKDFTDSFSLLPWGALVVASLCFTLFISEKWNERMNLGVSAAWARQPAGGQLFQRLDQNDTQYVAEYGFLNFNNDALRIRYQFPVRDFAAYRNEYGYADTELQELKQWRDKAVDDALETARKNRMKQEQLNQMCEKIEAEYKQKFRGFLAARGFRIMPGNKLIADMPGIVKKNVRSMKPVAFSLNGAAGKLGYQSDEIISAAASFVQTAVMYENVPSEIRGRRTGGLYPPVETMLKGKGDCDSKTALLASILLNWDRIGLVGVGVPQHYLMGVLRNPAKGDAFVEYKGLRYVLVEPAGPAWLMPGMISRETSQALNSGENLRIEPLTN